VAALIAGDKGTQHKFMQTKYLTDPTEAANLLREGAVVAVPTETVYGLAARFDRVLSVSNVFQAKGRPSDNPLIIHLADVSWLSRVAATVPGVAQRLLDTFAPGPITVTVPRGSQVSDQITAGLSSVAVRIPDQVTVRRVLNEVDVPLVAPSANRSGRPSPTTWQAVRDELDGLIDAVLIDAVLIDESTRIGIESTVVDCCSDPPRLLRAGGISYEDLLAVVPTLQIYDRAIETSSLLPSPGLRHRHYAPQTRITLVDQVDQAIPDSKAAVIGLGAHPRAGEFAWVECFENMDQYARALFICLRRADESRLEWIYCQRVPATGIGRGLMDRLQRAAGEY
jgi:L-threonylcarbamoyladenylate synthase